MDALKALPVLVSERMSKREKIGPRALRVASQYTPNPAAARTITRMSEMSAVPKRCCLAVCTSTAEPEVRCGADVCGAADGAGAAARPVVETAPDVAEYPGA